MIYGVIIFTIYGLLLMKYFDISYNFDTELLNKRTEFLISESTYQYNILRCKKELYYSLSATFQYPISRKQFIE